MHMELINNTFIPEKEIPRSRRAAGRKAFLQTFRNLFTSGIISGDSWILTVSTRSAGARPTSTNLMGKTDRIILSYQKSNRYPPG